MFGWMGIKRVHAVSRCEMGTQTFQVGLQMVRKVREVPKVRDTITFTDHRGRLVEVEVKPLTWEIIPITFIMSALTFPWATLYVFISLVLIVLSMIGFDIATRPAIRYP